MAMSFLSAMQVDVSKQKVDKKQTLNSRLERIEERLAKLTNASAMDQAVRDVAKAQQEIDDLKSTIEADKRQLEDTLADHLLQIQNLMQALESAQQESGHLLDSLSDVKKQVRLSTLACPPFLVPTCTLSVVVLVPWCLPNLLS